MPIRTRMLENDLIRLGENIERWRKLRNLTAEMVSERAGISRSTLRAIESGTGAARLDNFIAVLRVLGISDNLITAADPLTTDLGRANADRALPVRVRRRERTAQ
jgi:transcriptional regulator with XRE-family HTH domain